MMSGIAWRWDLEGDWLCGVDGWAAYKLKEEHALHG